MTELNELPMKCNLCKCDLTKKEIVDIGFGDTYRNEITLEVHGKNFNKTTLNICDRCWKDFWQVIYENDVANDF